MQIRNNIPIAAAAASSHLVASTLLPLYYGIREF
jgi:hypothetical protein